MILVLFAFMANSVATKAQGIPLGEAILVSTSPLKKDADLETFESFMLEELVSNGRPRLGDHQIPTEGNRQRPNPTHPRTPILRWMPSWRT